MRPAKISFLQKGERTRIAPLLEVLGKIHHVEWHVCRNLSELSDEDAVIALDADGECLDELSVRGKSALVFADPSLWSQTREVERFHLASSPEAPTGMSGARMGGAQKTRAGNWDQNLCRQVVAQDATGPIWLRRRRGGVRLDVANVSFDDTVAYGVFSPAMWHEQLLQLIILIDFVREVAGDSQWTNPAPAASVIFDDPNLHSMRYGFVDYVELLESMRRNHYHVAVATIPIDAWYVSRRVAAFFREHPCEYSFLYHGNDHISNELARDWTQAERAALVTQALQRIARYHADRAIEVEKVMVAPHGACSDAMLRELAMHDFQGACISWGSLNYHNGEMPWAKELGIKNTEVIHELPVLSRTAFEGVDEKSIRLALFLHQPIILRGHHDDLRKGLGDLEEKIRLVNELAHPRWESIGQIMKLNYRTRLRNGRLEVRPYARCVEVEVPAECPTVAVDDIQSGFGVWDRRLGEWICQEAQIKAQCESRPEHGCGLEAGARVTIRRKNLQAQENDGFLRKWPALWPLTRRFLTETRDRVAPYVRR
jgi:hypothetical protein